MKISSRTAQSPAFILAAVLSELGVPREEILASFKNSAEIPSHLVLNILRKARGIDWEGGESGWELRVQALSAYYRCQPFQRIRSMESEVRFALGGIIAFPQKEQFVCMDAEKAKEGAYVYAYVLTVLGVPEHLILYTSYEMDIPGHDRVIDTVERLRKQGICRLPSEGWEERMKGLAAYRSVQPVNWLRKAEERLFKAAQLLAIRQSTLAH